MEILCLDSSFKQIHILDSFNSLIWTDRYYSAGDFEVVTLPTSDLISKLENTAYFKLKESEHMMLHNIEGVHTEVEAENKLTIKGESLEALLKRRIVWYPTIFNTGLQTAVLQLLDENVISPVDSERIITNFEYEVSTDPLVTGPTVDTQFWGEYVYDAIADMCKSANVGFKVTLTASGMFHFKLYAGVDHSYGQLTNPHVTFSPEYDNLVNSDYVKTDQYLRTVGLVAGEQGVGNTRLSVSVDSPDGPGTELERREVFINATGVSRNTDTGKLTDAEYLTKLAGKGLEALAQDTLVESFDGQVDTTMFNYGDDFLMGDVLQIADDYGHSGIVRVIELIFSQDGDGIKIYPTFITD